MGASFNRLASELTSEPPGELTRKLPAPPLSSF